MVDLKSQTPLIALDFVAVDLETTGLDLRSARVIEIGAVRHGARSEETFARLVSPGAGAAIGGAEIHGIDAERLRGAPAFAEAYGPFRAFVGESVLVGHSLGFDLAMLKRECALAGLDWQAPRTLDTRLLGEIVAPRLPEQTLETLAGLLGVTLGERHRALGDARSACTIFLAMIPRLRDAGIRTLGEAEEACRQLSAPLERYHRAGWVEPIAGPPRESTLARLDSYPYRHRIADVMSAPPRFIGAGETVGHTLRRLAEDRISSLYVGAAGPAALVAIVTERDILRAIAREGVAVLDQPVGAIASRPLQSVPANAYIYRALGRMSRLNIRHLAVVDEADNLVGALSQRDLLRLRAASAVALGDDIDQAGDLAALGRAWAKLAAMARALLVEEVSARDIAGVIAREVGALTRRSVELAVADMVAQGLGGPPCPFCVLVLGSAGRGESLLAMDQDNALLYDDAGVVGDVDAWFAALGERFTAILHAVGVPLCPGNVMASNRAFRGSLATWRQRIAAWVRRADPADLLNVDIVFDLRPIYGEGRLAVALMEEAVQLASGEIAFLKALLATHGRSDSPFTLLGNLRLQDGRIDLKKHGLSKIVAAARVIALARGSSVRSSHERLKDAMAAGVGVEDLANLDRAHALLLRLILDQQLKDIALGKPPGNAINPSEVDTAMRQNLKSVLSELQSLDEFTRDWLSSAFEALQPSPI